METYVVEVEAARKAYKYEHLINNILGSKIVKIDGKKCYVYRWSAKQDIDDLKYPKKYDDIFTSIDWSQCDLLLKHYAFCQENEWFPHVKCIHNLEKFTDINDLVDDIVEFMLKNTELEDRIKRTDFIVAFFIGSYVQWVQEINLSTPSTD